jgi:cation:H+ antiporter
MAGVLVHILIFSLSLLALAKGADYFVEYSARLAKRFGVSDLMIGLTVTSIGTSLPELASSMSAALQNQTGIIIGSVIGSNIANIGLILGVSAVLAPFRTDRKMHDRDGYVMLASVLLFFAFVLNNQIETWEAVTFLALYFSYLLFVVKTERHEKVAQFRDFMQFVFDFEYVKPLAKGVKQLKNLRQGLSENQQDAQKLVSKEMLIDFSIVVVSCAAIIIGARYLIEEAVWIAKLAGLPESIVGLSMIAVGTSLPELLVSISAVRKNKGGIVVGNVVGSNIANLLLILGTCGIFVPINVSEISVTLMTPILLFFPV